MTQKPKTTRKTADSEATKLAQKRKITKDQRWERSSELGWTFSLGTPAPHPR